ncbi:hypothetical protein HOY82DRAFT_475842 [Tuber indicum]|nr:hypothetical protein HOY82DRAFT_475842 [Tuber indicum]
MVGAWPRSGIAREEAQVPYNIDFSQKPTRWGESGVYGFTERLDRQTAAQFLLQPFTPEAGLQTTTRQFEGLFPVPIFLEPGITQPILGTPLAPHIKSYPKEDPKTCPTEPPGSPNHQ